MKLKLKIVLMCLVMLLLSSLIGSSYIYRDLEGTSMLSIFLDECTSVFARNYSTYRYGYISSNDKMFYKNSKVTRSDVANMIFKIENLEYGYDNVFEDTKDNGYVGVISAIVKRGYMSSIDNKFMPDNYLTRSNFAEIVTNIIKNNKTISLEKVREYNDNFNDIETDDNKKDIIKLYELGLFGSKNTNKFRPQDFLTKEEAIVILNKVYGYNCGDLLLMLTKYYEDPYMDVDEYYWAFEDIVRATVGLEIEN